MADDRGVRRVLLAKRISDDKGGDSESIDSQDKRLRARAYEEGVVIVGHTEDRSVSGDVDFIKRPSLGEWMTEQGRELWDELWVTNQDRLSRDEIHVMSLVFQMLTWKKTIVVLDDHEFTQQMKTPEGRAILHVKSLGPHKELERIKARVQDSHDRRRYTKRWPGGIPPYGYVIEHRFENGKTAAYLAVDDHMRDVLREMAQLMIEGQSFTEVARRLNDRGELTARDANRVRKGKPVKARGGEVGTPEKWSETSVKFLMTDESLLGYKKHRTQVLMGEDGEPIRFAEPIFTAQEWKALQAAVQRRLHTKERRVNGTSPLYGVVHCSVCQSKGVHKVTVHHGTEYRYYQCGGWPKPSRCLGISVRAEEAEELVEILFLQEYGHQNVTKRVWRPGSDVSDQLEDVEGRIRRLMRQDEEGDWDDDRAGYRNRMDQLKAQKAKLTAMPVVRSGWYEEDQGITFLELWGSLDLEGRRKRLIESGYRIMIGKKTAWLDKVPIES